MSPELKDILFLDIETIRCTEHFHELSERLQTQWSRKAGYFRKDSDLTDADLFKDKAGIYAEFGKVIVIGVGKITEAENGEMAFRTKYFADTNEEKLLTDFKNMLEKMDANTIRLCAHNGKEFDFPYLSRRMLVNGIKLPEALNVSGKKPWEIGHLDTLDMWKFGDYKHYTSLDLLTAIFDIPSSKGSIDGSMVSSVFYNEGDIQKIAEYCVRDVVALAQLFLKMKCHPIIKDQNIVYS